MIQNRDLFKRMPPLGVRCPISGRYSVCPICGKKITAEDWRELDYVRTRRGEDRFFHTACALKGGKP